MKKMTLNQKLGSMTVVLWVGLLVIGLLGAWQQRDTMMTDRRAELVVLMDEAFSIVKDYYAKAQQHALTDAFSCAYARDRKSVFG